MAFLGPTLFINSTTHLDENEEQEEILIGSLGRPLLIRSRVRDEIYFIGAKRVTYSLRQMYVPLTY